MRSRSAALPFCLCAALHAAGGSRAPIASEKRSCCADKSSKSKVSVRDAHWFAQLTRFFVFHGHPPENEKEQGVFMPCSCRRMVVIQFNKSEYVGLYMKTLYFIGGTMGAGKTTVGQQLKKALMNSVFLDGDWCWDANPFQVTEETREMVVKNICCLLNNFLHCSVYEHIIFCWVMHEQAIIDNILEKLDTAECRVIRISLISDESNLCDRLTADVISGVRTADIIDRSIARISMYQALDTVKLDTNNKTVQEIADEIMKL